MTTGAANLSRERQGRVAGCLRAGGRRAPSHAAWPSRVQPRSAPSMWETASPLRTQTAPRGMQGDRGKLCGQIPQGELEGARPPLQASAPSPQITPGQSRCLGG